MACWSAIKELLFRRLLRLFPASASYTAGKVVYVNSLGALATDADLSWNDSTNALTIGGSLALPDAAKLIIDTGWQLYTNDTTQLFLRDNVNVRQHIVLDAGASSSAASTTLNSNLIVNGSSGLQLINNGLVAFGSNDTYYSGQTTTDTLFMVTANVTRLTVSSAAIDAITPIVALSGTAIPAGGTTGAGLKVSSTANFGVFFGSGAPSLSAAKGSLYLRSDGSGVSDRAYINTDGGTTWTALTTAA